MLSEDEKVKMACQARLDYQRDIITKQEQLNQAQEQLNQAREKVVKTVKALMKNMNLDLDKALDTLEIQGEERDLIKKQIENSQQN